MKLTSENVSKILNDCLFKEGEDTTKHIVAHAVRLKIGFHPERLESHKQEIIEMLNQLPEEFKASGGGGMSFMNACVDAEGDQWAEHSNIDELLCLGLAIQKVEFTLPREDWRILPGGMPYFVVNN